MSLKESLEAKLKQAIDLSFVEILNESENHHVPPNSETHFRITAVSDQFKGLSPLRRHRLLHEIFSNELKTQIHALALHLYTDEEWRVRGHSPESPACQNQVKIGG